MGILHQSRGKGNAAGRTLGETMSASRLAKKPEESAGIEQIHDISQRPQFSGLSGELGIAKSQFPIQAKLTIGQPNDRYEEEADRVASQVVQQINAPASVQSSQGQSVQRTEAKDEEEIQAKLENTSLQRMEAIAGGEASTDLESSINIARGGGQSLDAGLQWSMGQAMGADFSGVKVHTDAQSEELNQAIQAKAFTTGQDVFFRQGEYNPGSRGGQELLAHELTHVVQQKGGAINEGRGMVEPMIQRVIKVNERGDYRIVTERELQQIILENPDMKEGIEMARDSSEVFSIYVSRHAVSLTPLIEKAPSKGGGGMYGRLGGAASDDAGMDMLDFAGKMIEPLEELEAKIGTEGFGTDAMGVEGVHIKRVAKHKAKFEEETGFGKAKEAVEALFGKSMFKELAFDITHLKGWGQVGPQADKQENNLVAATKHANTEMMFFDNGITGRKDIIVKTWAEVFKGTSVAKVINMEFALAQAPDMPFFSRQVYAFRPQISKEEAAKFREEAKNSIAKTLAALDGMMALWEML